MPRQRKRKAPPTRFPDAVAASYARAISNMIRRMHSVYYAVFQQAILSEAKNYRAESMRADGALDVILAALQYAQAQSESVAFKATDVLQTARDFVQRVNYFNRRNVGKQIERVKGIDPTTVEPWAESFLRASIAENVTYIESIRQEYHKRVESIVLQGVKNGESLRDMTSAIKSASDVSHNRAKFIARDQTGSITGQLTAKRHQAAGASRFRWSTSGDERVRQEHRAFDGKVYTYEKGAGSRGLIPGQDYRCRCVGYPIFDDEETD